MYNIPIDIDECSEGIDDCDDNANCVNTVPLYDCTCNDGYDGNGTYCKGMRKKLDKSK